MKNILFVCTGNSARSIIAESIINNEYSNKFKAYSAGSNPTGKINDDVKRFLEKNKNYDLFEYRSKNFEDFLSNNIKIDYVVTVCNNANNEVCPVWTDKKQIIHWDVEDPVSKIYNSNDCEKHIIINNTFNDINKRISDLINDE